MGIKLFAVRLLFLGFILQFFLQSGCKKNCTHNNYSFRSDNCFIIPVKDSIIVGDTVWVSASIPSQMNDILTNQSIDYSQAENFGSAMGIKKLTTVNNFDGAVDSFMIIKKTGNPYTVSNLNPHLVLQLSFVEVNSSYIIEFGLVAQRKGVYSLSITDMPDVVKNCNRASIELKFNSSIDPHLHYLKDLYYGGGNLFPIDSTHTYNFKVY